MVQQIQQPAQVQQTIQIAHHQQPQPLQPNQNPTIVAQNYIQDENSLEAAPQTEIPPSPANKQASTTTTSSTTITTTQSPVVGAVLSNGVDISLNQSETGSNGSVQASPSGSADASSQNVKKYPFGNANCTPFKRTNVPPPERATRLPVSRIKNIMKFDPDVNIITQEAAYLVAKCTEQFVEGFAKAAYESTMTNKRKTLQKKDIENAVLSEERYSFLDGIDMGNGS